MKVWQRCMHFRHHNTVLRRNDNQNHFPSAKIMPQLGSVYHRCDCSLPSYPGDYIKCQPQKISMIYWAFSRVNEQQIDSHSGVRLVTRVTPSPSSAYSAWPLHIIGHGLSTSRSCFRSARLPAAPVSCKE